MFCKNCGNIVGDGEKFCQHCGAPIDQNPSAPADQNGTQPYAQQGSQQIYGQTMQKPLGMKWFKFIVNFHLIFGVLLPLSYGLLYFTGNIELTEEKWDILYSAFPSLKVLNIVFGVLHCLLAAYFVVIRFRMVRFKKNAPLLFVLSIVAQLIFAWGWRLTFVTIVQSRIDIHYSDVIPRLIVSSFVLLIYAAANIDYFRKRKFMFAN